MARDLVTRFTYQSVEVLYGEELGSGSYGEVYKAKCDELLCAAKLLHPILLQNMDMEPRRIRERFEQECQFLSNIKHPNIVQFLGTIFEPNGRIVLLMELMDESLTHFLERIPHEPIEYHLQINFCYDIALALAYLHSNNIVHRDLSSNNILLLARARAKVTDFGVSKIIPPNHRRSGPSLSVCPGTPYYMPPEALDDDSARLFHNAYSTKLDCFSYGVLCIQIVTKRYPSPGGRTRPMVIAGGTMVRALVAEVDRRANDIDRVPAENELRGIFLECLCDDPADRPSTQEICHCLVLIKQGEQYNESLQNSNQISNTGDATEVAIHLQHTADLERQVNLQEQQIGDLHSELEIREMELRECRGQITRKNRYIEERNVIISRKEQEVNELDAEIQTLRIQLQQREAEVNRKEQHIQTMIVQNEDLEQLCSEQQKSLEEREEVIQELRQEIEHKDRLLETRGESESNQCKLTWKVGNPAPKAMRRSPDAALSNNTIYLKYFWGKHIWSYSLPTEVWTELPDCPNSSFSLAIVRSHLTIIGGKQPSLQPSDALYSFMGDPPVWSDTLLPPMPTKRYWTMAMCYGIYLIVVGGEGLDHTRLPTVEVLDTEQLQWWVAAKLPLAIDSASTAISDDFLYIGSGSEATSRSFIFCCLDDLLKTLKHPLTAEYKSKDVQIPRRVWKKGANTPFAACTLACLSNQILAIGGWDNELKKPSASVFTYISVTDTWIELDPMQVARSACFAVTLSDNTLYVLGGNTDESSATAQVEIASISD